MAKIVIAGGGICGLAAAMMLADDGHGVTVIERDVAPAPPGPDTAADWDRRSVAQFGLGHWMHSRGTAILRDSVPSAFERIRDNGGLSFNLVKYLLGVQGIDPEPDDDRFDLLTGRRSTLEWARRRPQMTIRGSMSSAVGPSPASWRPPTARSRT